MSNMGNCASLRASTSARQGNEALESGRTQDGNSRHRCHRSMRHAVSSLLPDETIAALYPIGDNYVVDETTNTRSPKSLQALCVDTICRSLPRLNGELPSGLPADVVSDIVTSLLSHRALNATTLRVLKNCELSELTLSHCRGVTDDWLQPLAIACSDTTMDAEEDEKSCSTSSFVSASSTPLEVPEPTILENTVWTPAPNLGATLVTLDLRGSTSLSDRGLLQLAPMGQLQICKLDGCHSIVGRGLVVLENSHMLHTLSMANCRRLTDEAIINVSHLVALEHLNLDGCRCLTNRSLEALANLYNLRKLDLSQCDLINNEGLEYLQELVLLEELSLGWCRLVSDDGIDKLTRQPGRSEFLSILRLARCPVTDEGVKYLGRLRQLVELDLNGCSSIGSLSLGETLGLLENLQLLDVSYVPGILRTSWQGKINKLKTLDLCYSGVRDGHLSRLANLPALEEINLDSCPCGDWSIAHLADNNVMPNLTSLDLADTDISDLGMAHLPKFDKLTRISLFYCNITNAGLRHLAGMSNLEVLNLDSREIGDDGLAHLRTLTKLRSLDIFSGRVTDDGCRHLSHITSLESLELCGGSIGDRGCTYLATLENLTSLNLSQNERITNRGAAALAALTNLRALNLSNTRVDSAALKFLSNLVNLKSLAMYGCEGMEENQQLDAFQDGLPALKCLRLNNTRSANDGTIPHSEGDYDDNSDDVEDASPSAEIDYMLEDESEMDNESIHSD